jgi:hypothetical protein
MGETERSGSMSSTHSGEKGTTTLERVSDRSTLDRSVTVDRSMNERTLDRTNIITTLERVGERTDPITNTLDRSDRERTTTQEEMGTGTCIFLLMLVERKGRFAVQSLGSGSVVTSPTIIPRKFVVGDGTSGTSGMQALSLGGNMVDGQPSTIAPIPHNVHVEEGSAPIRTRDVELAILSSNTQVPISTLQTLNDRQLELVRVVFEDTTWDNEKIRRVKECVLKSIE